jgi:anti-sigma regulatory factor (Ser/Thr protein kinase)
MAGQSGAYRLAPASRPRVQRSRLEVAALDTAPGCLRLHARHMLSEWGLPGLSDTAELLVSELVTNAVQAPAKVAAPPWADQPSPECPCVELRLTADDRALVIEVWDGHPAPPPQPSLPDASALGGRGLFLVRELSRRWGFYYPALPDSRDMRDFDRFRFGPGPVPPELRWLTGKVIWCEFQRTESIPAALQDATAFRGE